MKRVDWLNNKLTHDIRLRLKQGSKIEFKWYGNSERMYVGRIEVDNHGALYFVNEFCYEGKDELPSHQEGMRYYNRLDDFYHFTYFNLINA